MSSERPIRSSLSVRCLFPEAGSANLIRILDLLLALGFGDLRYRDEAAALSSLSVRVLGYADLLAEGGRPYSVSKARIFAWTSASAVGEIVPLLLARRAFQSRLLTWSARTTLGGVRLSTTSNG